MARQKTDHMATQTVRSIVRTAVSAGRASLSEADSTRVLAAYRIPVGDGIVVRNVAELVEGGAAVGYPLALKILSPDIRHKCEVGGVALNISDCGELARAAQGMMDRCREHRPLAQIDGFSLLSLRHQSGTTDTMYAGIALDRGFGPVVAFGSTGTPSGAIGERVLTLPPPDELIAREFLAGAEATRLVGVTRSAPLGHLLVRLGQLALDIPEITQVDLDPVLVDQEGVVAFDAHIAVAANPGVARPLPAKYPCELEQEIMHCGRRVLLRPVRPDDEPLQREFLTRITRQDLYRRFFTCVKQIPAEELARIDYERKMTFVAITVDDLDAPEIFAAAQAYSSAQHPAAEFAVLVRSDLKGRGLGRLLMRKLIAYCRARGTGMLWGHVLSDNAAMLRLSRELGFRTREREGAIEEVALPL
jgi:acetyltransferase